MDTSAAKLGLWQHANKTHMLEELAQILDADKIQASSDHAPEAFFADRAILRPSSLGTVGSGNHFVELQVVDEIMHRHWAYAAGIKVGEVVAMVHTGSRDVGFYVGRRWMDLARQQWPQGIKHPQHGLYGLSGALAQDYLQAMGVAARYAWFNRMALAELVREGKIRAIGLSEVSGSPT